MGDGTFRLSVDYGTSHTVAALAQPGGRSGPLLFDGRPQFASAVCLTPAGALLVGQAARYTARFHPEAFEPHPKRHIDEAVLLLGGTAVPIGDAVAAVYRQVAQEAGRVAGGAPLAEVVLTHPATWGAPRRQTLLEAARRVGWSRVRLVAEPVAAAAAFVAVHQARFPVGTHALVYDLGAGTFDVAVVRRDAGGYAVLAADGLADVGGVDIDHEIVGHLEASYAHRAGEDLRALLRPATAEQRRARWQFLDDVRTVKELLTSTPLAFVRIPEVDDGAPVGRDQLDQLTRPLLDRTVRTTQSLLNRAGLDVTQLHAIFLVGGSTRMPLVARLLHRALDQPPTVLDQPELVVAEGGLHTADPPGATDDRPAATAAGAPGGTPPTLRHTRAGPVGGTSRAGPVGGTSRAGPVDGTSRAGPVGGTSRAGPVGGTGGAGPAEPPRASRRRRSTRPTVIAGLVLLALLATAGAAAVIRDRTSDPEARPSATTTRTPTLSYTGTLLSGRPICAAAWNPAGTRYAVTSGDTGLEIYDQDDVLVRRFVVPLAGDGRCHLNNPGVHWDPGGTIVAVVGGATIGLSRLYFFHADTGATVVAEPAPGGVYGNPAWDSTGSTVAVQTGTRASLIGKDGKVARRLLPPGLETRSRSVRSISVSPHGDTFVLGWGGSADGPLLEVRRFADGALLSSVGSRSDSGAAEILAYHPAGDLVAVGINEFGVEVWDPVGRRRVVTLRGPTGVITDVRWSGNGNYLLAASHGQQQIHVFRAGDWKLLGTLVPHEKTRRGIGVSAGGLGNDGSVLLVPQGSRGIDVFDPA